MKSVIFVVFCAVTVFVSADQESPDQTDDFMDECADLTGIDKGNLQHSRRNVQPDAIKPTKDQESCFGTCMMTKLGIMDEFGKISDKYIREWSEPGKFEENKQKAKNVYEKCSVASNFDICKQWTCTMEEANRIQLLTIKKPSD